MVFQLDKEKIIKTTQEQAVGAWVEQLNQIRLDELIEKLSAQDTNLENALGELLKLKNFVSSPEHILGSAATKHGEIAENAQVYISNARKLIEGLKGEYTFEGVARTAPEDYLMGGTPIQQKFYNGELGNKTFAAIKAHLEKYPDFLQNGGKYEIPKDQYEKILECLNKAQSGAKSELSTSEWNLVQAIHEWEETNGVSFTDKVNSTVVDYADVQQGTIDQTIDREEKNLRTEDERRRNEAHQESKPSLEEGAKATAVAAAIEGGMSFCLSVYRKRKEGKKIGEFTADDWKEIGLDTAKATGTGAVRGASVYAMTNYTATPGAVASAFVTAVIGVISQANQLHKGTISDEEFILNAETVCLDATVSAVSSLLGQVIIPVQGLGAIIGNAVGSFMYGIAKDHLSEKEMQLIEKYKKEMEEFEQKLCDQYTKFVKMIQAELKRFASIADLAFDVNVNVSLLGSVTLAQYTGVPDGNILHNLSEVNVYMLS